MLEFPSSNKATTMVASRKGSKNQIVLRVSAGMKNIDMNELPQATKLNRIVRSPELQSSIGNNRSCSREFRKMFPSTPFHGAYASF
jgi:hypothetical protein